MDAQQITRLTAQWVRDLPGEDSTVLSGLGVWPLLALLADLAEGPAREELREAAGAPYDGLLPNTDELRMALGLWTRPELPLEPGLDKVLPPEVRGVLTSKKVLDEWVAEQTGGLLRSMPIDLNEDIKLVLASALAVKLKWQQPFDEGSRMVSEKWMRWLTRSDYDLGSVRRHVSASAGPITAITVRGAGEIDVRLVIGEPDRSRSEVLAAAIELQGDGQNRDGQDGDGQDSDGQDGAELLAGLTAPGVEVIESMSPTPSVILSMPYFEIEVEHDLLQQADVFGLLSATDTSRGHFPGLSPEPLAVSQAKQAVLARFSATGFEAAAVTAMAFLAGSAPTRGAKALLVVLDRPFAFVAVHRPTGIPLVAGWVTESAYQPASDETFIRAKPSKLRPRHCAGCSARSSVAARPMPQMRSTGLASTSTREPVPSR